MKLNDEHHWEEFERPFRKYWVMFLKEVGEEVPVSHDLPKIRFGGIK